MHTDDLEPFTRPGFTPGRTSDFLNQDRIIEQGHTPQVQSNLQSEITRQLLKHWQT
jgi:hypothetical protein